MSNKTIGEFGNVTIDVPATGSVVVFSKQSCQVSQVVGTPNHPETLTVLGTVTNGQTTFGPFTLATQIRIDAGATSVSYDFGIAPFIGTSSGYVQITPGVLNATGALTAAMMVSGIVTSTTAAAVTATVPVGSVMDAASGLVVGDGFDWTAIATGANSFTVTAASAHTLVGSGVVATVTSGRFRTVKTAAATYVTYRLA